jgi:transcriptional regulator with XRE-family HTH domain
MVAIKEVNTMKRFSFEKIKEFRTAAGMTQEGLAIAMTTPERRVYKEQIGEWENKENGGLSVTNLAKLAEALGKVTDDFFVE